MLRSVQSDYDLSLLKTSAFFNDFFGNERQNGSHLRSSPLLTASILRQIKLVLGVYHGGFRFFDGILFDFSNCLYLRHFDLKHAGRPSWEVSGPGALGFRWSFGWASFSSSGFTIPLPGD